MKRQARRAEAQAQASAWAGAADSGSEGALRSLHGMLREQLPGGGVVTWAAQQAGHTVQQYAEWALQDPAAAQVRASTLPVPLPHTRTHARIAG
jgi:hypothetical protein